MKNVCANLKVLLKKKKGGTSWDYQKFVKKREATEKRKSGNYNYIRETKGFKGVCFYISENLWKRVVEVKKVSERIRFTKTEVDKITFLLTIIRVYAPILDANVEEIDMFYNIFSNCLSNLRFAEDIVLINNEQNEIRKMVNEL